MSEFERFNHENQPTPEAILEAGIPFLERFGVIKTKEGQSRAFVRENLISEISNPEGQEQFLEALSQLDPRHKGERTLVRWELEADQTKWDDETKDIIMDAAEGMGMLRGETPLIGQFDAVISLPGARKAPRDRAFYAADAIHPKDLDEEPSVSFDEFVIPGSKRPLKEAEQGAAADYAPNAQIEFDLSRGAAIAVTGEYPDLSPTLVFIDDEKAHTALVVEKALEHLQAAGRLPEHARVGAVTTQIYQAATAIDLARAAEKFGVAETFCAGNPSDAKIIEKRTVATYTSEVVRTLKAAARAV